MCLVEIYAAGPRAIEEIDRTIDGVQAFLSATLDQVPGREQMPPEIVRAMVGGIRKVIHSRLYRHEEEDLLELTSQMWDWLAAYPPPPAPLRRPRSRAAAERRRARTATTRSNASCARLPQWSPRRATRR